MKSPVSGLSLFIHLAIIAGAMILSAIIGRKRWEAFRHALSANGATVSHRFILQFISVAIILFLGAFMLFATSIAVRTGIREGASEPQVIFVKKQFDAISKYSAFAWGHRDEWLTPQTVPEKLVRTSTFVRADGTAMK